MSNINNYEEEKYDDVDDGSALIVAGAGVRQP